MKFATILIFLVLIVAFAWSWFFYSSNYIAPKAEERPVQISPTKNQVQDSEYWQKYCEKIPKPADCKG